MNDRRMTDDLQRKLRKLGVVRGARELEKPPVVQPSRTPQITPLPGREITSEYGSFWLDKRVYEPDYNHGSYQFSRMSALCEESLSLLGVPDLGPHPAFVDTETTGLAGGSGTIAFLIGIGVWEGDAFVLHLIFIRNPEEEEAALRYTADVLRSCTGLVTYNGRTFDLPLLQTRFILNRLVPEWLEIPHLDLLTVARRLWRDYLPSRRLGEIEQNILGITRTDEDLPSFLIPFYYRQYLETGDTTEMRRILYHNVIDILSLVSLLIHVVGMVEDPDTMQLAAAEWAGVGTLFFQAGWDQRALTAWNRALAQEDGQLPEACTSRLCGNLGVYYKRRDRWDMALQVWDTWSDYVPNAVQPLVEKAMYYEWTVVDAQAALAHTESAIDRVERYYVGLSRDRLISDLRHRHARLMHKLANSGDEETSAEWDGS